MAHLYSPETVRWKPFSGGAGKTEPIEERRVHVYLDTLERNVRWAEFALEADESLSRFDQKRVEYAIERSGPGSTELVERSEKFQDQEQEAAPGEPVVSGSPVDRSTPLARA